MMRTWIVLLLAVGCYDKGVRSSSPPPAGTRQTEGSWAAPASPECEPAEPGQPMTREQCTCLGGRVNLSRGGSEREHCAHTESELGTVRLGIEGGWCCKGP